MGFGLLPSYWLGRDGLTLCSIGESGKHNGFKIRLQKDYQFESDMEHQPHLFIFHVLLLLPEARLLSKIIITTVTCCRRFDE